MRLKQMWVDPTPEQEAMLRHALRDVSERMIKLSRDLIESGSTKEMAAVLASETIFRSALFSWLSMRVELGIGPEPDEEEWLRGAKMILDSELETIEAVNRGMETEDVGHTDH